MQKQPPEVFCKKTVVKKLAIFTEQNLCLESLFNSEYCEIFKSSYFEAEIFCFYFMKETSENASLYFMIGFLWGLVCIQIEYFCDMVRNKLQRINIYFS